MTSARRGSNQYRQHRPALELHITVPLDDEPVLTALASSPNSSPQLLRQLSKHTDWPTLIGLANNPSCPPTTLWRLAAVPRLSSNIAQNPACPPGLLQALHQRSCWLDLDLARNPNSPPQLLRQLAQSDHGITIRILVADHPRCPPRLLATLVDDTSAGRRWRADLKDTETTSPCIRALANPACPPSLLRTFSTHYVLRATVAGNPSCPSEDLTRLAADTDPEVRSMVAGNPACPPHILNQLLQDHDRQVADLAAHHPSLPRATLAMWQLTHSGPGK
jgi:hypothetical protein